MVNYEFYGYSPDAFVRDPATGKFTLDPDYKASDGRVHFEVQDNDGLFDGDRGRNEIGEDSDQRATVYDGNGEQIAKGKVYVEEYGYLSSPDGADIRIDMIEIAGVVVGYVTSEPLHPGMAYGYGGANEIGDDVAGGDMRLGYDYYEKHSVACFGPGTMIATQNGEIPVEWLDTSDMVLTRDDGFQPVLWVGRTRVPAGYFNRYPEECPVRISPGSLGSNSPSHPLNVTGDHRVMIRAAEAELMFASTEVLAPAKAWADTGRATRTEPTGSYMLTHILLGAHHLILAQGAWVESLFAGHETMRRLDPENRAMLHALLGPELARMQTARPCLTRKEAVALLLLMRKPDACAQGDLQTLRCA